MTFPAKIDKLNKFSVQEWRNGRRAGFRHQFPVSEGSTPFSRTNPPPGPSVRRFCFIPTPSGGFSMVYTVGETAKMLVL